MHIFVVSIKKFILRHFETCTSIKTPTPHIILPTNVDCIVGHHVLVVVEPKLNVIVLLLVTKKTLEKTTI